MGVAHRGVDDKGYFSEGPCCMMHRQFRSTAGLPAEPVVLDSIVLAMDGEVPKGDATYVAQQWEKHGPEALNDWGGNFALAVWDRNLEELWLVRDAAGTRPLFWAHGGGKTAFASEPMPLLGLPWVSRDVAFENLAEYLSFRYVHAPKTLLKDVSEVPPGHLVRLNANGAHIERWWTPRWAAPGTSLPGEKAAAELVDGALKRSVARSLQRSGPAGILLSGGLDSTSILFHARQEQAGLPVFTVAIADDPVDEAAFAARIAKEMESEHHIIRINSDAIVREIDYCSQYMGAPLPSAAGLVQSVFYKEIRPMVRTLLSGVGGDEMLAGRGMQFVAARIRRAQLTATLPRPASRVWRGLARRAGMHDLAVSPDHFGRDRSIGGSMVYDADQRVELFRDPALVRPGIRQTVLDPLYQEVDTDPINAILHVRQRGILSQDNLARCDRMAAHQGIEIRYPMLDAPFIQQTAALPGFSKVASKDIRFLTKWPLRMAMSSRFPGHLLNRPKRLLPNPLDSWLRTAGSGFLSQEIEALCHEDLGLFLPGAVRSIAAEHLSRLRNHGVRLWTLILLHRWMLQLRP